MRSYMFVDQPLPAWRQILIKLLRQLPLRIDTTQHLHSDNRINAALAHALRLEFLNHLTSDLDNTFQPSFPSLLLQPTMMTNIRFHCIDLCNFGLVVEVEPMAGTRTEVEDTSASLIKKRCNRVGASLARKRSKEAPKAGEPSFSERAGREEWAEIEGAEEFEGGYREEEEGHGDEEERAEGVNDDLHLS